LFAFLFHRAAFVEKVQIPFPPLSFPNYSLPAGISLFWFPRNSLLPNIERFLPRTLSFQPLDDKALRYGAIDAMESFVLSQAFSLYLCSPFSLENGFTFFLTYFLVRPSSPRIDARRGVLPD